MSHLEPDALVDTRLAIALVAADHEHHRDAANAVGTKTPGLAGHAAFETFFILTQLPPSARRTPDAVARLIAHNFSCDGGFPSDRAAGELLTRPGALGVAGGAVYDALVGAAAVEHGLTLITRDRRAAHIYWRLDVKFVLVD